MCGEKVFMPHEGVAQAASQAAQQADMPLMGQRNQQSIGLHTGAWTSCLRAPGQCLLQASQVQVWEVPCRLVVFLRRPRTGSACFAVMLQAAWQPVLHLRAAQGSPS